MTWHLGSLQNFGYTLRSAWHFVVQIHSTLQRKIFHTDILPVFKYLHCNGIEFSFAAANVTASAWFLCVLCAKADVDKIIGVPIITAHSRCGGHSVTIKCVPIASAMMESMSMQIRLQRHAIADDVVTKCRITRGNSNPMRGMRRNDFYFKVLSSKTKVWAEGAANTISLAGSIG